MSFAAMDGGHESRKSCRSWPIGTICTLGSAAICARPSQRGGRFDALIARYTADLTRAGLTALTTEHVGVDPEKLAFTVGTELVVLPRMVDALGHAIPLADTPGHRCAAPCDRTFRHPMPVFLARNRALRSEAAAVAPPVGP